MSNEFNIDQVISVDFEADSELNIQVGSVFQGASIDDTVISTKKTWSSQKISNELDLKANTSSLATVATSGSFDDLSNKPTVDTSLSDSSNNAIANSAVKGALDNKANSSDVYTKTQVYTKTEVDAAIPSSASEISYDNTSSSLVATNTQAAIDEVNNKIPTIPDHYDAEDITYDNTDSGLSATDVQAAIDELASTSGGGTAEDTTFDDTNVTFSANNVQSAFENIIKKLTQAQYDALTPAEQLNGTIYMIIDSDPPLSTGLNVTDLDIQTIEYTTSSL